MRHGLQAQNSDRPRFLGNLEARIQSFAKLKDNSFRLQGTWKKFYREQDSYGVYQVDPVFVKTNLTVMFCHGGHGFVHECIPHDEIWISDYHPEDCCTCDDVNESREMSQNYRESLIAHEIFEHQRMAKGDSFVEAHRKAEQHERQLRWLSSPDVESYDRKAHMRGKGDTMSVKIASELLKVAKLISGFGPYAPTELSETGEKPEPAPTYSPENVARKLHLPRDVKVTLADAKGTDVEILTYENFGKLYAVAFAGKGSKPIWHYRFRDEADRQRRIDGTIESRKERMESKQKQREERKQYKHTLQIGDVLYSSWGYDQTNVSWYQVVLATDKAVKIREIGGKPTDDSHVVPAPGSFKGPAMTKIVRQGDSICISSYASAHKWDGKPKYVTPYGFGH